MPAVLPACATLCAFSCCWKKVDLQLQSHRSHVHTLFVKNACKCGCNLNCSGTVAARTNPAWARTLIIANTWTSSTLLELLTARCRSNDTGLTDRKEPWHQSSGNMPNSSFLQIAPAFTSAASTFALRYEQATPIGVKPVVTLALDSSSRVQCCRPLIVFWQSAKLNSLNHNRRYSTTRGDNRYVERTNPKALCES